MILLKHRILKGIMLRHTKEGRSAELRIHPKTVIERWLTLDETEEGYYTMAYKDLALLIIDVEAGILMNDILFNYVFDLVLRLRKVADHPYFQIFATEEKGTEQCGLCDDPVEDLHVTSCAHIFCKSCLFSLPSSSCPLCSKQLTVGFTGKKKSEAKQSFLDRLEIEIFQSSTKIEALREEISDMFERDGSARGIVFSEFSSFLYVIHFALKMSGVSCVQVDGYTPKYARSAAIKNFKEDPSCRILLTTFKVGGVGLNLTVASNVFLMEPSWNPLVELQAQDRIHQIGQYKPTRIVRFLIKNTIEERLLELQEEKKKLFEGTVCESSENPRKSRESDLRFILQL